VPTLHAFAPRFLNSYARANRQKPSTIVTKQSLLRVHLVPLLGHKRLDAITNEDIQRLKSTLVARAPKTVNNILTVLSTLLKAAVEWSVIERMPCRIRLVKVSKPSAAFHDFDAYERLVGEARTTGANATLTVLLGGEAGLRCGEMIALEWADVDLATRQLCVQRSSWEGHVTAPKGGRLRYIPLTIRLEEALRIHRHLRGPLVLCDEHGAALKHKAVLSGVRLAARRGKVLNSGVHVLRHTFCSHLAMRGAPARAIQELAGHVNITTTQRYMHLSPAAIEGAIRLLDQPSPDLRRGDMVETADRESATTRTISS
jgi:integrase